MFWKFEWDTNACCGVLLVDICVLSRIRQRMSSFWSRMAFNCFSLGLKALRYEFMFFCLFEFFMLCEFCVEFGLFWKFGTIDVCLIELVYLWCLDLIGRIWWSWVVFSLISAVCRIIFSWNFCLYTCRNFEPLICIEIMYLNYLRFLNNVTICSCSML